MLFIPNLQSRTFQNLDTNTHATYSARVGLHGRISDYIGINGGLWLGHEAMGGRGSIGVTMQHCTESRLSATTLIHITHIFAAFDRIQSCVAAALFFKNCWQYVVSSTHFKIVFYWPNDVTEQNPNGRVIKNHGDLIHSHFHNVIWHASTSKLFDSFEERHGT